MHSKGLWTAAIVWTGFLGVRSECQAQDPEDYRPLTVDVSMGKGWVSGSDGSMLRDGFSYRGGGGFALTGRSEGTYRNGKRVPARRWNLYLTANFLVDLPRVSSTAIPQAIRDNPQNPALLSATSATAHLSALTLDPTFRFPTFNLFGRTSGFYVLGGFGWLHRSIDFTGIATQGPLLQSSAASVFTQSGNSGAVDAGVGVNCSLTHGGRVKIFLEGRVFRGLAINGGTTLVPVTMGFRW